MQHKERVVTAPVLAIARDHAVDHVCLTVEQLVAILARGLAVIHVTTVVKVPATDVKPLKDKMGNNVFSHLVAFCFENYKNHNIHSY